MSFYYDLGYPISIYFVSSLPLLSLFFHCSPYLSHSLSYSHSFVFNWKSMWFLLVFFFFLIYGRIKGGRLASVNFLQIFEPLCCKRLDFDWFWFLGRLVKIVKFWFLWNFYWFCNSNYCVLIDKRRIKWVLVLFLLWCWIYSFGSEKDWFLERSGWPCTVAWSCVYRLGLKTCWKVNPAWSQGPCRALASRNPSGPISPSASLRYPKASGLCVRNPGR